MLQLVFVSVFAVIYVVYEGTEAPFLRYELLSVRGCF